jgi:hypothetical protein
MKYILTTLLLLILSCDQSGGSYDFLLGKDIKIANNLHTVVQVNHVSCRAQDGSGRRILLNIDLCVTMYFAGKKK